MAERADTQAAIDPGGFIFETLVSAIDTGGTLLTLKRGRPEGGWGALVDRMEIPGGRTTAYSYMRLASYAETTNASSRETAQALFGADQLSKVSRDLRGLVAEYDTGKGTGALRLVMQAALELIPAGGDLEDAGERWWETDGGGV